MTTINRMPEVVALREVAEQRLAELRALEAQHKDHVDKAVEAARVKATAEAGTLFGERLSASREQARAAAKAMRDRMDQLAREGAGSEYPLGTKVYEWTRGRHESKWKPSGRTGILELITKDSAHPANRSRFHVPPELGSPVVRHLLKNGKPGSSYTLIPTIRLTAGRDGELEASEADPALPYGWFYEGDSPRADR